MRGNVRRVGIGTVVAIGLLGTVAGPAEATFPGSNGRIAFTRFVDPNGDRAQIFSVSPNGHALNRVTHRAKTNWFPDFSPDGERLLFTHTNFDGMVPDALFSIDRDGTDPFALASNCSGECLGDSSAAFAPDGEHIVFERAFGPVVNDAAAAVEPHIADVDGTDEQAIPVDLDDKEAHDSQWSPDGERIAVNLLDAAAPGTPSAIYVFDADGGNLHRVTPTRLNAGSPDWSPDGRRIVFNSSYEGQTQAEIYTVRPNGEGLHRIRNEPGSRQAFEATFAPNGKRIAFAYYTGRGLPHIWAMRRDGTHLRRLTHGRSADVQPDWGSR